MLETQLAREMNLVVTQRGLDEATVLAQAFREGIHKLYRDTIIEWYLLDKISREDALQELGKETLEEIEYQREAFARDVAWGDEQCMKPSVIQGQFSTCPKLTSCPP